jgi:chemotaxis protein methyltransferase CheR
MAQHAEHAEHLGEHAFEKLAAFIHGYCGIHITPSKRTMLEAKLHRSMNAAGITSVGAYCRLLTDPQSAADEEEIVRFIDALTVNKTDFFREAVHFDFLERQHLPALSADGQRLFKVWSAACAIGAEPYSIAMVLDDFCHRLPGADYFVLATDICTKVLDQAISGRYNEQQIAHLPQKYRKRHLLMAKDRSRHEFRMAPHLRAKMAFSQVNLMSARYPVSVDYDAIFCRNVLIYFDKPTQIAVLTKLAEHLQPKGCLILGHAESIVGLHLPLRQVANTIYMPD